MIFTTPIADRKLTGEELRVDKKNCLHFGPCGLGKRAMYLNSFYIENASIFAMKTWRGCLKKLP